MDIVTVPSDANRTCEPVTAGLPLADCPLANRPLRDWQREALEEAGLPPAAGRAPAGLVLCIPDNAWLSPALLRRLAAASAPCAAVDAVGRRLAWVAAAPAAPGTGPAMPADADSFLLVYPWDVLRLNEALVRRLAASDVRGEVSPAAHVSGPLRLGKGSRLLPGVCVEGPAVIGEDCLIGPNCYIRPGTSIGPGCRVGQGVELKNCLMMEHSCVAHLSYCGDTIIGRHVNLGGGTITANVRHDGQPHRSMANGTLTDTGRLKFGAVIGDGVHTGIHTAIYPGRKLWPGTWTRPGAVVRRDLGPGESV